MTSQSKRPRKKQPEALDWRELAGGPALRGLAEVLATPREVARERAAKRIELNASVGDSPAVGETVFPAPASIEKTISEIESNTEGESPTEVKYESTSVGDSIGPSVGISPTGMMGWLTADGHLFEMHRAQRVLALQDSLGLGEERVYQALWQATENNGVYPEEQGSKIFSLGYDRIAHLVRLNEKSVRILLPKLIVKKVLEVVAPENSAAQTGRTYRIFSGERVLERQRAANLLFIVKNGRAIEFVHPLISPTVGMTPSVGVSKRKSGFK
jgi:hypothetical protein